MYAFLWRPKWMLSHLLVLVLIASMIAAMAWQISRLHDKQAANELVARNSVQPPVSPQRFDAERASKPRSGSGSESGASAITRLQYRRVEVVGSFDTSAEVAIESRTLNGAPGRWIATPLVPSDGSTPILVVRGFVPFAVDAKSPPFAGAEPPTGPVTVVGWAQPTQTKGFFGSTDAPTGHLNVMARVDVERFARQYRAIRPYWLQLSAQLPPSTKPLLSGIPLPEADEGPHRGYAGQWAIFTLIAIIGYPLILRRVARQRRLDDRDGERDDERDGDRDNELDDERDDDRDAVDA